MSKRRSRRRQSAYKRLRTASVKAVRAVARRKRRIERNIERRINRGIRVTGTGIKRTVKRSLKLGKRTGKKTIRLTRRTAKQTPRIARRKLKAGKRTGKALARRLRVNARKAPRVIRKRLKTLQRDYRRRQKERLLKRTRLRLTQDLDFATIRGAQATQAAGDTGGSKPGEPPKMRTGKGRASITAELRRKGKYKIDSRVFVDKKIAPYMALWEFRPDKKQRPFLKPSVQENLTLLGNVIGQNLKQLATAQPKRKAKVN